MNTRTNSFGQSGKKSFLDNLGIWLSTRRIVRVIKKNNVQSMGDFGCGFNAGIARETRRLVARSVIVDVALDQELVESSEFDAYVGILPDVLENVLHHSLDLVVMNSVLEHLDYPVETLEIIRRILKPGGILFINVPSWFGKIFLEFTSFRLGLSPAEEMEDHRRYYNKRELWLELRRSGFLPSKMKIRRHKLGMNVFAIATVEKG